MEQENKKEYTVAEVTGKVKTVEESSETQKQQKVSLKVNIIALCTAIGLNGVGIYALGEAVEQSNANYQLEKSIENFQQQNLYEAVPNKINEISEAVNELNNQDVSIELEVSNEMVKETSLPNSEIEALAPNLGVIDGGDVTLEPTNEELTMAEEEKTVELEATPALESIEVIESITSEPVAPQQENSVETLDVTNNMLNNGDQGVSIENNKEPVQQEVNPINDLPLGGVANILDGTVKTVSEVAQPSVEIDDEYSLLSQEPVQENFDSAEGKVR